MIRAFVSRHPAVTLCAALYGPIILLDRMFNLHALAMVLAVYVALSISDAWDEEMR